MCHTWSKTQKTGFLASRLKVWQQSDSQKGCFLIQNLIFMIIHSVDVLISTHAPISAQSVVSGVIIESFKLAQLLLPENYPENVYLSSVDNLIIFEPPHEKTINVASE